MNTAKCTTLAHGRRVHAGPEPSITSSQTSATSVRPSVVSRRGNGPEAGQEQQNDRDRERAVRNDAKHEGLASFPLAERRRHGHSHLKSLVAATPATTAYAAIMANCVPRGSVPIQASRIVLRVAPSGE